MAKDFEVKNKIENFKAHLSIIKGKLNQVTQEINDAIELKESYSTEITNLEDRLTTKQNQLLGLRRELNNVKQETTDSQTALQLAIDSKEYLESEHAEMIIVLRGAEKSLEDNIKVLNKDKVSLLDSIADINHEYDNIVEHWEDKVRKVNDDFDIRNKQRNDILDNIKDIKEVRNKILTDIDIRMEELASEEQKFKSRIKEVEDIANSYNRREEKLSQQEADLKVYARRVKRKYEELYPGRKLII